MAPSTRRERGAALATVLVLMVAVLMNSVSAARAALDGALSARVERDRQVALQAAQAALADAEHDIEGAANPASPRASLFASGGAAGFVEGCGHDAANLGLCLHSAPPAWQRIDLADPNVTVAYGGITGAAMPAGSGPLAARLPRYIIEFMPMGGAGPSTGAFYRITAIGFGRRASTRVVLQSWYRRPPAGPHPVPDPLPARRISWREVGNWPELHAAATH
jgi:type IV pilus assembly protein PilX